MKRFTLTGFVVVLLIIGEALLIPVFAQNFSLDGSSQFRRQLDSFFWNYNTSIYLEDESYRLDFSNNFNSRLFLLNGNPQNVQDENTAQLFADNWLNDSFGIAMEARSYRYSNTGVRQDLAMAGLHYRPEERIQLTALGGIISDERSGLRDDGLLIGFRGSTEPFETGDFILQTSVYADYGDINPRTFQSYRTTGNAVLDTENFSMNTDVRLGRSVRDSYQASSFFNRQFSDFTESVRSDTTEFRIFMDFPVFEVIQSRLEVGNLTNIRRVTNNPLVDDIETTLFDTRILRQELNVRYTGMLPVNQSNYSLGFGFTLSSREARLINTDGIPSDQILRRNEILQNSNFDQDRFEIFSNNRIQIGENNTSLVSGRISIMQYNTPELNRDDRDELFYQLRVTNRHHFSDYFRSNITLAGEATHSVYLFSERSIENNWRRSIRLIPEFEWDPTTWLRLRNRFLVRANYTVDDFELPGRPRSDQVSREFGVQTEAEISLAPQWWLSLSGSRNELRIGRLDWQNFTETPTDTLITYDTRAMISHQKGSLLMSVGMRYFVKLDFLPQATITATQIQDDGTESILTRTGPGRQTTVQIGPMVEMRLPLYHRNELIVNGWYQMQAVRQRLYTDYPEELETTFRAAEQRARRQNYPNIEMIARFRF